MEEVMKVNKATLGVITLFILMIALVGIALGQVEIPIDDVSVRTVLIPGPDQHDELRIKVESSFSEKVSLNPMVPPGVLLRYGSSGTQPDPFHPHTITFKIPESCWVETDRGYELNGQCDITALLDYAGQPVTIERVPEADWDISPCGLGMFFDDVSYRDWCISAKFNQTLFRSATIADEIELNVGPHTIRAILSGLKYEFDPYGGDMSPTKP